MTLFLDTHDDKPVYVTREDLQSDDDDDDRMKALSAAWLNKYATRNGSPTLETFANPESVEMINGRVAQVGWMMALYYEITKNETVWEQVFKTRNVLHLSTVQLILLRIQQLVSLYYRLWPDLLLPVRCFPNSNLLIKMRNLDHLRNVPNLLMVKGAMIGIISFNKLLKILMKGSLYFKT